MKNELKPKSMATATASVFGVLYIVCAALLAIAPAQTLRLFANMFHGIDITQIATTTVALNSVIIGFVEIIVISAILGWLFAVVYNKIN